MLLNHVQSVLFFNLLFTWFQTSGLTVYAGPPLWHSTRKHFTSQACEGRTQDLTTPRANTLFDDADDIQRQLDNEARDRMKYGKSKTIWVFHFPTRFPAVTTEVYTYRPSRSLKLLKRRVTDVSPKRLLASADDGKRWDYKDQVKWGLQYPDCMGKSQSPVDLPYRNLLVVRGARQMLFSNHDVLPEKLSMINDGISVKITGTWPAARRPVIYGGAAHSRRYVFDSMRLHWPSEHTIGGLQYPMESQALYVSAEYGSMEEALQASSDKMALLGVASLYKFSNHTQKGVRELLKGVLSPSFGNKPVSLHSLSFFSPPFKEYVCYQGSLTMPPCTESVLWLVRARSLPVTRKMVDTVQNVSVNGEQQAFIFRQTQPLNDRKVFFFN